MKVRIYDSGENYADRWICMFGDGDEAPVYSLTDEGVPRAVSTAGDWENMKQCGDDIDFDRVPMAVQTMCRALRVVLIAEGPLTQIEGAE